MAAANAVEDRPHARATRPVQTGRHDILSAAVDHPLGPQIPHQIDLARTADRGDHARAPRPGHLDQQSAHPAGPGVDQDPIPRRQGTGFAGQNLRRQALQQYGRRLLRRDLRRQRDQPFGGDGGLFGIAARDPRPGHAIPDLERRDLGAQRTHGAGALHTRRERERLRIQAAAVVTVDEIDARGFHRDDDFAQCRDRIGHDFGDQGVRAAGTMDAHGLHGRGSVVAGIRRRAGRPDRWAGGECACRWRGGWRCRPPAQWVASPVRPRRPAPRRCR